MNQECDSKKQCCPKKECSGVSCPITGFKLYISKKFISSAILMIVWVNLFACLWHGFVMSKMYQQTANLWRPEMRAVELNLGLSITAIVAAYIFMKGYECAGWREGLRFGIIMTALFSGIGLITHATQPIPYMIIVMWSLGDLITYSVGGIMLSALYCKMAGCCKAEV